MQRTVLRRVSLELWLFTYQYSKFPSKKPPTEIERIWQGYRKARFHYLQGKTERKRESVKEFQEYKLHPGQIYSYQTHSYN